MYKDPSPIIQYLNAVIHSMRRLCLIGTFAVVLTWVPLYGQEICNNGIDDDGDNFVDCFDSGCATNSLCDGFFIGNDALCQTPPSSFPDFQMEEEWESPNETTNHLNRVSIGDLDLDGIPEVVSTNVVTRRIYILNGQTGKIKKSIAVNYAIDREVIVGNIDNDNCADIFTYGKGSDNKWRIYRYDCNLTQVWRSPDNSTLLDDPLYFSLANFDGDNFVELYYKDEVVDAHTGIRLIQTGQTGTTKHFKFLAAPVAVDIMGDEKLELVAGGRIYNISLPARTLHSGTATLLKSTNRYRIRQESSSTTSVADYDLDGKLDVIITGSDYTGTDTDITKNTNKNTTVFLWTKITEPTDQLKTYIDKFNTVVQVFDCKDGVPGAVSSGSFYSSGWRNGTGRINLADIDGDGKLNAVYVSGKYLYALDENWQQLWRMVVNEETSGYTGCTLFDFNGDGKSEIIYRDEKYVYIIYGDKTIGDAQKCISRTNREYPLVADIDGDGSTELCVTCAFNDNLTDTDFCNQGSVGQQRYSVVRVYRSATEPWVPARKVWNQHGYFNVNVNDDLTIPKVQQKHHLTFYDGPCIPGEPGRERRPLNSFLNQAPFLDSKGCPIYASPDIAFVAGSLSIIPPSCPERDFKVSFQLTNKGDVELSGKLPITFYAGDPMQPGAQKIDTILFSLNGLAVNSIITVTDRVITGTGGPFDLYVVLNDAGTSLTSPIILPNTNFLECGYLNNIISAPVQPNPAPLTGIKLKDNIQCDPLAPPNGAVRAFVPQGVVENTADFNFYWSIGPIAKPIPADSTGPTLTSIPEGDYTVFARHKLYNCGSQTATVSVSKIVRNLVIKIVQDQPYDNCETPNAVLRVVVNDTDGDNIGEDPSLFTYEWYEGPFIKVTPQLGVSDVLSGLRPITYSVLVTDKATGCPAFTSFNIPDQTVVPTVNVTKLDILCSPGSTGSATATVGGSVANFTFSWYNGSNVKPTPDFTGSVYSNLPAGKYTVVAQQNTSRCKSAPVTVTIIQTINPVASATVLSHFTSCDPTKPNGVVTASVGGVTSGYTFQWYKGQNTLPPVIGTTPTLSGLKTGIYTVKVTDNATGCADTEEVRVDFMVVVPTVSLVEALDATRCSPDNGLVRATVSLDRASDYTFYWYEGNKVKAIADFADADSVLNNVPPGVYTFRAVHNTKFCETTPVTATVGNSIPVVNYTVSFVEPSDCASPTGMIDVTLSAPGNTSGFDIQWYNGKKPFPGAPLLTQNAVTTSQLNNLIAGVYSLVAINRDTGCEADSAIELNYLDQHELIYNLVQDKVETCVPNNDGSVTVTLTPSSSTDESEYDLFVYTGTNDPGPSGASLEVIAGISGQLDYTTGIPLTPGFYTVVAVSKNPSTLGCRSIPRTIELEQDTQDPVYTAFPPVNNMNCVGVVANGQVALDIINPADYTFTWFEGKDTASPALGTGTSGVQGGVNGEIATNLPEGFYTVLVTKSAGASAGCFTTSTYAIFDNPAIVSIDLTNDVIVTEVSRCDLPTMGNANVQFVRENNVPMPVANFAFEWYRDVSGSPVLIAGEVNPIILNLSAGKYYVKAVNNMSNCETAGLVEFIVADSTINTVGVDLIDFTVPTQCKRPAEIGELNARGFGNSTSGYTYRWFAGPDTSAPLVATTAGPDNEIAQVLSDGFYTVEVMNNTTRCVITDTYELPIDVYPVIINTSSAPLTICNDTGRDGSVFATVTNVPAAEVNNYNYNWYFGQAVKPMPDSVQRKMDNLFLGDYRVVVIDPADPACQATDTVTVGDARVYPIASAMPLAPLTICDPTRPDGVASASVGGNIVDYQFNWYSGTTPVGSAFYTGSQASGLAAGQFSVIASHLFTGCSDTTTVTIDIMQAAVDMPQIAILFQKTSCVSDNGALAASVNGNVNDYIFNWYTGPVVTPVADQSGEVYDSLAIGVYSVTATSLFTGCTSLPVTEEILENPEYPDLLITTSPATCQEENGVALLYIKNDVVVSTITWTGTAIPVQGPILAEVPSGVYNVTVTSLLGCTAAREVIIGSDIHPFNGVSRNADGKNDKFFINCIENFPSNQVQIFNRAGTLVYEAEGYDNIDVYFDGRANKGISLMGNNLPDGTYYYIVNKNDGSKPKAGYLEIVN